MVTNRNELKSSRPAITSIASTLVLLFSIVSPSQGLASPCGTDTSCLSDPNAYQLSYTINSTSILPIPITNIMDFYGSRHVTDQGMLTIASPPSLPTGSGILDAGVWRGNDRHFLVGLQLDSFGITHLVMMMNPAIALQIAGQPFDALVNDPNVIGGEAIIIDRITHRDAEFNDDVWSLFNTNFRPNALDPTVLVNSGPTFTMVRFSDGEIIGTAAINVSVVPLPAAVWLFGSALGVVGVMRRKIAA